MFRACFFFNVLSCSQASVHLSLNIFISIICSQHVFVSCLPTYSVSPLLCVPERYSIFQWPPLFLSRPHAALFIYLLQRQPSFHSPFSLTVSKIARGGGSNVCETVSLITAGLPSCLKAKMVNLGVNRLNGTLIRSNANSKCIAQCGTG